MVSIENSAINDKSMVYGYAPRKPFGKPTPSIIIIAPPKGKSPNPFVVGLPPKERIAPGLDEFVVRRPKKPDVVVITKKPKHKPVYVLPNKPHVSRKRKAAMGLASFFLSGLGQALNGQWGKAAGFFFGNGAAVAAGFMLGGPVGAVLAATAVKTACIYDAAKNAKPKEVAYK